MESKLIKIAGKVVHGAKYGRLLGFPTANLDRRQYARDRLKVKLGVWEGKVKFQKSKSKIQIYKAAIVIGPTDNRGLPKIEAHLLNFKGNLYGKKLMLTLNKYLRPFKKFKTEKELISQIRKDINKIK